MQVPSRSRERQKDPILPAERNRLPRTKSKSHGTPGRTPAQVLYNVNPSQSRLWSYAAQSSSLRGRGWFSARAKQNFPRRIRRRRRLGRPPRGQDIRWVKVPRALPGLELLPSLRGARHEQRVSVRDPDGAAHRPRRPSLLPGRPETISAIRRSSKPALSAGLLSSHVDTLAGRP
jgi:hypothetical protein